jgi:hypothetical protein
VPSVALGLDQTCLRRPPEPFARPCKNAGGCARAKALAAITRPRMVGKSDGNPVSGEHTRWRDGRRRLHTAALVHGVPATSAVLDRRARHRVAALFPFPTYLPTRRPSRALLGRCLAGDDLGFAGLGTVSGRALTQWQSPLRRCWTRNESFRERILPRPPNAGDVTCRPRGFSRPRFGKTLAGPDKGQRVHQLRWRLTDPITTVWKGEPDDA